MNFSEYTRLLRVAHQDISYSPTLKLNDGERRIVDLYIRVVKVTPETIDLIDIAHIPEHQVELVGRLVNQDSSSLVLPCPAPGIGIIVILVAPSKHSYGCKNGLPYLSVVDCTFHSHRR